MMYVMWSHACTCIIKYIRIMSDVHMLGVCLFYTYIILGSNVVGITVSNFAQRVQTVM